MNAMIVELFKVLSAIHPLSKNFKRALERELLPLSLPKHHMLLEVPDISRYAYFLSSGFAMAFAFVHGKKVTEAFWTPGQILVASSSFFEQVPSAEYIQLMDKSELLCISYDSVQKLFSLYPEATHLYRIIMNRQYGQSRMRVQDFRRLSAQERLEKLISIIPDIEQTIPQESIASYLGITPQSLSRLKRKKGAS
ncbi:MAG TPA: Crp/Fnr family transcriptional regulator [Cyclobacteriaceae bacterium]|nr:Crp/Fnr family transcriptional regulator [Cyclobacteriaceae bacterium]